MRLRTVENFARHIHERNLLLLPGLLRMHLKDPWSHLSLPCTLTLCGLGEQCLPPSPAWHGANPHPHLGPSHIVHPCQISKESRLDSFTSAPVHLRPHFQPNSLSPPLQFTFPSIHHYLIQPNSPSTNSQPQFYPG